jgi:hypothetical protein
MKYAPSLLLLLVLNGCVIHTASLLPQSNKQLSRLDQEREKLKRQTNPVDRTKTQIKISEILLTLAGDAIKAGDLELMEDRLSQYSDTIQDAHQTMVKTGRDPHSKPGGFKDLEIALRRELRQLEDLGGTLTFDQREPVMKARSEAADIRDALLKALLGGQNAPSTPS